MKYCPTCRQIYQDAAQVFCTNDGSELVSGGLPAAAQTSNQLPPPQFAGAGKANGNRSPLLYAGVALIGLVLMVGLLTIVGAAVFYSSSSRTAATSDEQSPPDTDIDLETESRTANKTRDERAAELLAEQKPRLITAIGAAYDAQIEAARNYNTDAFDQYFSGEALRKMTTDVERLKRIKSFALITMENIDYESFKLNEDGTEAAVRVSDAVNVVIYLAANKRCLGQYTAKTKVPIELTMKRHSAGWKIDAIVDENNQQHKLLPCPKK